MDIDNQICVLPLNPVEDLTGNVQQVALNEDSGLPTTLDSKEVYNLILTGAFSYTVVNCMKVFYARCKYQLLI